VSRPLDARQSISGATLQLVVEIGRTAALRGLTHALIDFKATNGVPVVTGRVAWLDYRLGRAPIVTRPENTTGVWPMMSFLALHHIAAQRGDGLRPELVKLLERSRAITEADPASPAMTESKDVVATRFPVDLSQTTATPRFRASLAFRRSGSD
jgi:hypothetical protein